MRFLWLLMVAPLLAGCMASGKFVRPAMPVAEMWPDHPAASGVRVAGQTHWREFFSDPRLQSLIEAALANNRDLRVALSRMEAARAEYGVARVQMLPALNASFSQSGSGRSAELAGVGNSQVEHRTDLSLGVVSFELDFWNRLGSLSDSARASYLASEAARRAARLALISEVANAYFSLLEYSERKHLASLSVELQGQALGLINLAKSNGFASSLDSVAAEELLETTRYELAGLEKLHAEAVNKLELLVGGATEALPNGRELGAQDIENNLAPGLPAEVLLSRPDIIEAEQRLQAADANIAAARAAFLPKILLTASLGLASRSLAGLFGVGQSAWNYQPSLTLPIFDWGRAQGGVDVAEARKNVAVAEYEKKIQEAFREVADLLAGRSALLTQQKALLGQVEMAEERVRIMEARAREGYASMLNVLEAKRGVLKSQQMFLQLRRQQLENATLLYRALGGGELLQPAVSTTG